MCAVLCCAVLCRAAVKMKDSGLASEVIAVSIGPKQVSSPNMQHVVISPPPFLPADRSCMVP